MTNQIVPGGFLIFFLFRDFNVSDISLIVNSIRVNFEFVLNSKLDGLQLLSSKFDMEQNTLFNLTKNQHYILILIFMCKVFSIRCT